MKPLGCDGCPADVMCTVRGCHIPRAHVQYSRSLSQFCKPVWTCPGYISHVGYIYMLTSQYMHASRIAECHLQSLTRAAAFLTEIYGNKGHMQQRWWTNSRRPITNSSTFEDACEDTSEQLPFKNNNVLISVHFWKELKLYSKLIIYRTHFTLVLLGNHNRQRLVNICIIWNPDHLRFAPMFHQRLRS